MKSAVLSITVAMLIGGCAQAPLPPSPIHFPLSPLVPLPLPLDQNGSGLWQNGEYCKTSTPEELEIELPDIAKVSDLEKFPQSIVPYVEAAEYTPSDLSEPQSRFFSSYYSPWLNCTLPLKADDVAWPLRALKGGYGSNLRPIGVQWFQEMADLSNFDTYGTFSRKGIAIRRMDIRSLPSDKPLYKNPALPGEGYPFDMLQNSSVSYAEPVFVSHLSKDGEWSYIFTNSVSGWVKTDGIALLEDETVRDYLSREKLFVLDDRVALYDDKHRFATHSRIGMVLALDGEEGENYYALSYASDGSSKRLMVPKSIVHRGISPLNTSDLTRIGDQMLKNTYGWGGMYGERDCSSMIREMMTPFGIWLPRNSSSQAKKGEVIPLEGLSDQDKISVIKSVGIPFETIVYLKGHVLLYLGTYDDTVMVLHNIWGIRTITKEGVKGRHIVGKAVISTLEMGSELETFDPANKLLSRVSSINIFTRPSVSVLSQGNGLKKGKKAL